MVILGARASPDERSRAPSDTPFDWDDRATWPAALEGAGPRLMSFADTAREPRAATGCSITYIPVTVWSI